MDLDPLLGGRGLGIHRGANICGLADTQADHRWPAPAVIITIAAVSEPLDVLSEALAGTDGFTELRYHDKSTRTVSVEKAKVEATGYRRRGGVGVRVLEGGRWGSASTSRLDVESVRKAADRARNAARANAGKTGEKLTELPSVELARGEFDQPGLEEAAGRTLEERIVMASELEASMRKAGSRVSSASCSYNEIFEHKAIVTSDGARAAFRLVRPELRLQAVAERDGQLSSGFESVGATGGWDCLFRAGSGQSLAEKAARTAIDLLSARHPEGGKATVIVDGGIMRGTDVVKAMALGADAVGIGRLQGLGISAAGQAGIVRALELLEIEIRTCLALLGVTGYADLDETYLHAAEPVARAHALSAFPLLEEDY